MSIMFLEDLQEAQDAGCSVEGCDHKNHDTLFLHGVCHPGERIEASLKRGENHLLIACGKCHEPIIAIALARRTVH
jgi:hypothetical protein